LEQFFLEIAKQVGLGWVNLHGINTSAPP
jgi:hypothetical protein